MSYRAAIQSLAAGLAIIGVVAAGSASFASSSTGPTALVVQPGDTLWGIAGAHGVTVDQLAAANGISPNDFLLIGQRLTIPTVGSPTTTAAPATASSANFCATASFTLNPYGEIPSALATNPGRLALRPVFVHWAETYGVAPALVEAVAWEESGWQQGVVSADGAVGIGQIMPASGDFVDNDLLGADLNINAASDNIQMEAVFLAYLIREVGNNPCLVAAAYYQGPAAVLSYGVYSESEQYIRDVLALEPEFS